MTDNEIIKAMEKFKCVNCNGDCAKESYEDLECPLNLVNSSLDLINRQKAEIERLKEFIEKDQGLILKLTGVPVEEYNQKIKSEAIKEFAKRLKEKAELLDTMDYFNPSAVWAIKISVVNNLVKEMTEQ